MFCLKAQEVPVCTVIACAKPEDDLALILSAMLCNAGIIMDMGQLGRMGNYTI